MRKQLEARLQKPRKMRTATDQLPVIDEFSPKVNLKPEQKDVRGLGLNGGRPKPRSQAKITKLPGFTNAGQSY